MVMTIVRHVYSQLRDNIASKVLPCEDPSLSTLLSLLSFGLEARRKVSGGLSKIEPPSLQEEVVHVFLPSLMHHIASERIMKETACVSQSSSEDIKKQWLSSLLDYWRKRKGEEKKGKKKSKESDSADAAYSLSTAPTLLEPYTLSLCSFVGSSPVAQLITLYHTFYSIHSKSVCEMRYIAQLLEDGIGNVYCSAEPDKYQPASVILKILKNALNPSGGTSLVSNAAGLPLPLPSPLSNSSSSSLPEEMVVLLSEMLKQIEEPTRL